MAFVFENYLDQKLFGAEKGKVKSALCRSLNLKPIETPEHITRVLFTRGLPYKVIAGKETEGEHKNEIYMIIQSAEEK